MLRILLSKCLEMLWLGVISHLSLPPPARYSVIDVKAPVCHLVLTAVNVYIYICIFFFWFCFFLNPTQKRLVSLLPLVLLRVNETLMESVRKTCLSDERRRVRGTVCLPADLGDGSGDIGGLEADG